MQWTTPNGSVHGTVLGGHVADAGTVSQMSKTSASGAARMSVPVWTLVDDDYWRTTTSWAVSTLAAVPTELRTATPAVAAARAGLRPRAALGTMTTTVAAP